jgi:4,5:9,10-diseco-3-hydroxy-5,9,17-trioxoandrosta-1(10),2-diene-4-oate hydrolase
LIECALKAVVYDSTVITREKVEESYQMIKLPGAQASFLRTVRAGVTWRGLHPDLLNATWETLPSITKPTLIVWGRQDPVLPVAQAYVGGEQIPDTRLYLFDRCGHFPQLEYPTAFNHLVETFLSAGLPSQADRFAPMVIDQTNRQTSL